MASLKRGEKRGRKKINMRPSDSGGQIYMSKDYAKKFRETNAGDTELQKLIEKKITERMLAGEMTPKESGAMKAETFIDQVDESVRQKYANKKYGGKVKKMKSGGKVRGYGHGGSVCRGGGAAVSGTKFSGVK